MRIVPGTGMWTVNGRTLDNYFPNKLHQQVVNEPFATLELEGRFDVIARIHGGGITGQAGALRLGVARCAQRDRRRGQPPVAEEGRPAHPRRPRQRAQEGRPQEGPQGSAVQQALIAALRPMARHLRHGRGPGAGQRRPHRRARAGPLGRRRARPRRRRRVRRHRPLAVVGRDTRTSGEFLEAAVVAGLRQRRRRRAASLRVLPTPGVAYLTGLLGADLGVVISACHNPMPDNGIKFLARGGLKLDDERRGRDRGAARRAVGPPDRRRRRPGRAVRRGGRAVRRPPALDARRTASTGSRSSSTAPTARPPRSARRRCARPGADGRRDPRRARRLSTSTTAAARPTSRPLQAAVVEHGADVGFALDGDADRCLAVDPAGAVVDGDQILAILALAMRERGELARGHRRGHGDEQPRLPCRRWSAPGITRASQTAVGDRYVLEAMRRRRLHPRRRAVRPRHHERARHHRRRHPDRAARCWPRMAATGRPLAELAARRRPGCRRCWSTCPASTRPAPTSDAGAAGRGRRGGGRARRHRPGAAAPLRHRAAGAGDGRGGDRRAGRAGGDRLAGVVRTSLGQVDSRTEALAPTSVTTTTSG